MSTGVRGVRKGVQGTHCAVITPHDTNELPIYAEAVQASADCTADIVTIGGDAVTAFFFVKGYNQIRVARVKNNVSNSATLWAIW